MRSEESIPEIVQLFDGIPANKSTKNLAFKMNDDECERREDRRGKSSYSVRLFKDVDVKSIEENTQLIGQETIATGPLDRKDIFYCASLALLPEYRDVKSSESSAAMPMDYHLSMIHESKHTTAGTGWHYVSHKIKSALRLLFDVTILKSPAFLTFAMSNFLYVFALYIPYMFVKSKFHLIDNDDILTYLYTTEI